MKHLLSCRYLSSGLVGDQGKRPQRVIGSPEGRCLGQDDGSPERRGVIVGCTGNRKGFCREVVGQIRGDVLEV